MESKMKVNGLVSRNTIVLHPSQGQAINISKETDSLLFAEVAEIIESGNQDELLSKYMDIKGKIERYSLSNFTVDEEEGKMYLKGDEQPMPDLMVERLLALEKAGEDFMPLIRFWKKLKSNPSQRSIEQLYGFMVHNSIGLTETGDIVVEKGVSIKDGKLVDSWTETIDNSIGETVEMDRDKVNADPNVTCSHGLHVGAPEFVREWYGTKVLIQCTVNPTDVVSVPTDYNNTKMRVCKYTVVGYSDKSEKPIFKLSDFITTPSEDIQSQLDESRPEEERVYDNWDEDEELDADGEYEEEFYPEEEDEDWGDEEEYWEGSDEYELEQEEIIDEIEEEEPIVKAEQEDLAEVCKEEAESQLEGLTANQILDYIEDVVGERMPYNPKSKRTIVKRGVELLTEHLQQEYNG